MSSHREAPEISTDPVADNTDTYAFVSPDNPKTVTIITNYLPAEVPAGGPTFFEFGDDVVYSIYVDNDRDGLAEIEYQFTFESKIFNTDTFLYNNGQILSLTDPHWSKRQFFDVTRIDRDGAKQLGDDLACPPCNIGPRSTPNYEKLEKEAIHELSGGVTVFAGQRRDPFFVDIGSIFDLADLRPIQELHLIPTMKAPGVDTLQTLNCHSIVLQVPISSLTANRSTPKEMSDSNAVLGIWGAASRRKARIRNNQNEQHSQSGPWVQVSRLGSPLFNEVLVPMARKDEWNAREPSGDASFLSYVQHPELAKLLTVLYPKQFSNLEGLTASRGDLVAVFLTGFPAGVVDGFQSASKKGVLADMLRLNVAVPPANSPKPLGFLEGDLAGFPNGRRVADDVTNIELKAVAGATYPLVEPKYKPDAAVEAVEQGITPGAGRSQETFPYVTTPHDGYDFPSATK
jgi:hypothetical protein